MNKMTLVLLTVMIVTGISIGTASAQNGRGRSRNGPEQLNLSETPYGGAGDICPNSGRAIGSRVNRRGMGQSRRGGQGGCELVDAGGRGQGLAGRPGRRYGQGQNQTARQSRGTRGQAFSTGRGQGRGAGSGRCGVNRQGRGRKGCNAKGNVRRGAQGQDRNHSQCRRLRNRPGDRRRVGRSGRRCNQGRRQTVQRSCGNRRRGASMGFSPGRGTGFGGCGVSRQGAGQRGWNANNNVRRGGCGQGRNRGRCGR